MSIPHQSDIEKTTWKTHRYFIDFESQINNELTTLNQLHLFHEDWPFIIDEISTDFQSGLTNQERFVHWDILKKPLTI